MSLATRHMIDRVTVWVYDESGYDPTDPFSDPGIWVRNELPCEFESGGETQKDQNGAEFQPQTTVYTAVKIERGSRIKVGSHPELEPPADTETVRKVGAGTGLAHQQPEFVGWTG